MRKIIKICLVCKNNLYRCNKLMLIQIQVVKNNLMMIIIIYKKIYNLINKTVFKYIIYKILVIIIIIMIIFNITFNHKIIQIQIIKKLTHKLMK